MTKNRSLQILVIDDNEMTRAALRTILHSDENYQVIGEATNGETGLELALRLKPDLVCLDVVMPRTDGLEVLRQIKKELPLTTVLMVTGNNDRTTVENAIRFGANGFIVKPFKAGTVLDTMAGIAANHHERKTQTAERR
jgi:two-component system chemotaxis response regulator CheY